MKKLYAVLFAALAIVLAACSQDPASSPLETASFTVSDYEAGSQDVIGYTDADVDTWEELEIAQGTISAAGQITLELDPPPATVLLTYDEVEEEGLSFSDPSVQVATIDGFNLADGSWINPAPLLCYPDCEDHIGESEGLGFIYVDRPVTMEFNQSYEGGSVVGSFDLAKGWHFLAFQLVDFSEGEESIRVVVAHPNSVEWEHNVPPTS